MLVQVSAIFNQPNPSLAYLLSYSYCVKYLENRGVLVAFVAITDDVANVFGHDDQCVRVDDATALAPAHLHHHSNRNA